MIIDLGDRTQLELTGADRAKFLHGFCTNDIKGLTPGRGCEAFVCNIQGKVLGRIFVFCTESSLWIDSEPGQEDALFNHLDRYLINEDVQIHRRTGDFADIYVSRNPPSDSDPGAGWTSEALAQLENLSHLTVTARGVPEQHRVVDWLGERGWLISGPREVVQFSEMSDVSPDVWNALRIEAGFPLYGIDITGDNLAQEVNRTARCISFNKGCYLGQEPIARIDALGHVNRELRPLVIPGETVPAPGTALLDPKAGTQIGVITSAAPSAKTPGIVVALGYLRKKFCEPGTNVVISASVGDVTVRVASIP